MDSSFVIIAAGLIFMLAGVIHGISGFGFSIIATSLMALMIDPKIVVPLSVIVASANSFYMAWIYRKKVLYKQILSILVITFLTIPLGTLYLKKADREIVVRSLGVLIVIISLMSIFNLQKAAFFKTRIYRFLAGALAGLFGGAFNITGPPLVIYAYNSHWPLQNAKANLQMIFSVMGVIIIASFIQAELLSLRITFTGLMYIPVVMVATWTGHYISTKIKSASLGLIINILTALMGLSLIIKG